MKGNRQSSDRQNGEFGQRARKQGNHWAKNASPPVDGSSPDHFKLEPGDLNGPAVVSCIVTDILLTEVFHESFN